MTLETRSSPSSGGPALAPRAGEPLEHPARVRGAVLLAWGAWAAAAWWVRLRPAEFDEPLLLRWVRACAEHPVRAPLALALVVWGAGRLLGMARAGARSAVSGPGFDLGESL